MRVNHDNTILFQQYNQKNNLPHKFTDHFKNKYIFFIPTHDFGD